MAISLIIKTLAIYFIILLIMKFMGKREIGQLSLFDFVVLLLIADVAVLSIDETENFFVYVIPIFILAIIQKILAFALLKVPNLRNFFDGKEAIIIFDGKLNIKEMRKQNYNVDDLLPQLRLKNIKSLSEIRYLFLEPNGEISIFKFNDDNRQNISTASKTLNVVTSDKTALTTGVSIEGISIFPFITSGVLHPENLQILKISEDWLKKEMHKQGYYNYKDIYYANYEKGKLFIIDTISEDEIYKKTKNIK